LDGRNNKIDMGSAHIDGNKGSFGVGQASINKNVLLLWGGPKNAYTIALDGEKGSISMQNPDTNTYTISLDGRNNKIDMGGVHIDGNNNKLGIGGAQIDGNKGSFSVGQASINKNVLLLWGGPKGAYTIGLDGENSSINMQNPETNTYTIMMDGRNNKISMGSVIIDGNAGDVILQNADCAEDFEVSAAEPVDAGTVMALNDIGQLEQGKQPYDKRVAGVISGAGDLKPGLVLGRQSGHSDRVPLALMGRVHCKVDAGYGSIEVGDLLTTSQTPGYAMKASDPARSFGAVIGKALRPLKNGRDLIPILVALQ
jgi:phage tail tube protein FII